MLLTGLGLVGAAIGNIQKIVDTIRGLRDVTIPVNLGTVVFDILCPLLFLGGVSMMLYRHFIKRAVAGDKFLENKIDVVEEMARASRNEIAQILGLLKTQMESMTTFAAGVHKTNDGILRILERLASPEKK